MTHQTKTQMHPADIQALKDRHDFLLGELNDAMTKAICHKANCHILSSASADALWGYAKALETASDYRRAVEKHEREMKAAGL
jgi:hypothetical protein